MTDDDRDDLIPRLFALLTARLEDGCTLAVEGQRVGLDQERVRELANQIYASGGETRTIADAIAALTPNGGDT